jgi:hypothetical protein
LITGVLHNTPPWSLCYGGTLSRYYRFLPGGAACAKALVEEGLDVVRVGCCRDREGQTAQAENLFGNPVRTDSTVAEKTLRYDKFYLPYFYLLDGNLV